MKKLLIILFFGMFTIQLFGQSSYEDLVNYYNKNKDEIGKIEQTLFDSLKDYCEGNEKSFFDLINSLPSYEKVSDEEISRVLPLSQNTFIRVLYSKIKINLLCYLTNDEYANTYEHHLYEYKKFSHSFGKAFIENDKGLIEKKDTKIAGIDSDWIIKNYRIRYNDAFCQTANGTIAKTGPFITIESKDKSTDLKPLLPLKFECTKTYYVVDGQREPADIDEPIHKFIVDFNQKTLYNSDFEYIASIIKFNDVEIICEGKNVNIVYSYKIDRQLGTYTSHSEVINQTPKVEFYDIGTVSLINKSLF